MKTIDVYKYIDSIAPFSTAFDWDNSGILVGDVNGEVKKIGLALDITTDVVREAASLGCDIIVSHHPVIFTSVSSVLADSAPYMLARYGISAICAHTNLDIAEGGVNDCLAECLELCDIQPLGEFGMGRTGKLNPPLSAADFALHLREKLGGSVRYSNVSNSIHTVAVCGGAGFDEAFRDAVQSGAQALVTSDIKHHQWYMAKEAGIMLCDAGHYHTENVVIQNLADRLGKEFADVDICILNNASPYESV